MKKVDRMTKQHQDTKKQEVKLTGKYGYFLLQRRICHDQGETVWIRFV